MTPRDFFIVVIRVLGLMWLGGFIFEGPVYVINIITTGFSQSSIVGLVVLVITSLMLWYVLERPHRIVDKLGVAKGFDQEMFEFGWSAEKVFKVAIIVTAGVVLFREVPNLCAWVFNYFQIKDFTHNMQKPDLSYLPKSAARIVLALLLFGERERIVNLLVRDGPKE